MRKKRLNDEHLYLVLDTQVASYAKLFEILKAAVLAGTGIVQLRDKNGSIRQICDFSRRAVEWIAGRALFIVNDHCDAAVVCGADGVHLGQDDLDPAEVRRITGPEMLIGVSCQTLEHLDRAHDAGADYIGFGSVFITRTKPERRPMDLRTLSAACEKTRVPLYAIGGITLDNADQVLAAGVDRIAVTRAVMNAVDFAGAIEKFQRRLPAPTGKVL